MNTISIVEIFGNILTARFSPLGLIVMCFVTLIIFLVGCMIITEWYSRLKDIVTLLQEIKNLLKGKQN